MEKRKAKKKRIIKNIVRVKFEIPITCQVCGGKVPAKRDWPNYNVVDEDFDDDYLVEIKVEPCPACEEKNQEKLNRAGALLLDERKVLQNERADAGSSNPTAPASDFWNPYQ